MHSSLIDAVRRRDADHVSAILRSGADPNVREQATGLPVLAIAAGQGSSAVVRHLLGAGADVHAVDSRGGTTALHKAVQGGDLETVRLLVEAGSFIDAAGPTTGHTPLMDALWYKWPDIVEYLLEQNAMVNLETHYGFSLRERVEYELGANSEGTERQKLLAIADAMRRRIEKDERAAAGQALMRAVTEGNLAEVERLLKRNADVDEVSPVVNGFNDGHTPLLVAARDGHADIARALIAAGADVNAVEPTFGAVPLHKAVYMGHADITGLLVRAPGTDIDHQGATNGYTPLHDALWHGHEECARVLLDAGARTDLLGHDSRTARDIAVGVFGPGHRIVREIEAAAVRARA
ncbi:ankyrin repeat domain-containing protein [Streptomyces albofaciens]|uniref:ankyrin repeat domain-containing protein n=1 Tax=Streptomyces albofaciens TaxID=66866 RepID=UPI001FCB6DDF|nr:ankyrin repeat domain-containing protein [Streptomyces albofaciens]